MSRQSLGRLQPVALREVWDNEAGSFTPWLAQEENIKLLGDAIGIELEVQAQEKEVGPFRADILCKDTAMTFFGDFAAAKSFSIAGFLRWNMLFTGRPPFVL